MTVTTSSMLQTLKNYHGLKQVVYNAELTKFHSLEGKLKDLKSISCWNIFAKVFHVIANFYKEKALDKLSVKLDILGAELNSVQSKVVEAYNYISAIKDHDGEIFVRFTAARLVDNLVGVKTGATSLLQQLREAKG